MILLERITATATRLTGSEPLDTELQGSSEWVEECNGFLSGFVGSIPEDLVDPASVHASAEVDFGIPPFHFKLHVTINLILVVAVDLLFRLVPVTLASHGVHVLFPGIERVSDSFVALLQGGWELVLCRLEVFAGSCHVVLLDGLEAQIHVVGEFFVLLSASNHCVSDVILLE